MYLITVLGNLLIILAVSSDSHLHTPMYFFLSNLSLVDICFTSTTVPKMLWNIQTQSRVITYAGCITQIYFYILFAVLDDILLTVMAYDRFVAICLPLHYMVIMNPRLCGLLVLVSWIIIVSLFYGTVFGEYLSSAATHSSHSSAVATVMYTVVTPMLNPFIYSLRNKDIKKALCRFFGMAEESELQSLISGLFLSMYLITVLGNLLIILAISLDSHLHTPMAPDTI
ncbi:olfactory receptor 7A17-like [Pipistrellus kuhlii]|uniref:olfactory receptor 7A17-like n=1 Tax=Pipistrellus kuhlii TaxID=59472 RepID=UPI00174F17A7|nr:olfactory receptor 7A17-like [Pipistrellus kuhlii]